MPRDECAMPLHLHKLKPVFVFSVFILSISAISAGGTQDLEDKAYLELNRELNLNQEQTQTNQTSKEEGAHLVFYSDAFAAVRAAIGGAQVNQLGDKISTALAETAINKTENLINQKANQMANSVGHGKTEISFHQLKTKNPNFSVKTIQPLTQLTDTSTQLTFIQAQISSGENHGEHRATINLGIGQRYLLEEGQSIAGINLFTDYEIESKHSRASLGLEYQRANFSVNVNKYYPLSDKVVIGDYTEEPLAGHDIKLTGQVPYLPWAKIKGTQYYWDAITGDDIKGTRLGIEVDLNASTSFEIGTENSNTAGRSGYARLRVQLPYKANTPTHFAIADKAFEDSSKLSLTHLNYVERSNKIRIEKLLNGVSIVLGEYNAPTIGATCTLYNASGIAIADGSGIITNDGSVTLSSVLLPKTSGLITVTCGGGTYTDEATGESTNGPTLRAAIVYSGTGGLTLIASPLTEVAYRLADTNSGDLTTIAAAIAAKNTAVATAFGLSGVDITTTTPTDLNTTVAANDVAGKFGLVLAAISQMGENSADANPTATITALVADMADGDIDGRATGTETVDVTTAINNFINGAGDNQTTNGDGAGNTGAAGSATGEDSIKGKVAINFISNYDGTGTAPTVQDYIDAGVTGVTAGNLDQMNDRIATKTTAETDTTSEIQSVINTAVVISFNIDAISDTTVAENAVFTGSTPSLSGDTPIGTLTYTLGGTDADDFSINSTTGVILMTARDFESPTDDNTNNAYEVTIIVTDSDSNTDSETQIVTVTDVFESETLTFGSLDYITVQSPDTDKVWLDRNLGASQVCTSSTDSNCYGNYYQWGRNDDGHELSASSTTSTLASSITPGASTFVLTASSPYDWTTANIDSNGESREAAWADSRANDICPSGYSVPTAAELTADTTIGDVNNSATVFSSFLKLPVSGYRDLGNGSLVTVGSNGYYWSRSTGESGSESLALSLNFDVSVAGLNHHYRAHGFSVRCIKD